MKYLAVMVCLLMIVFVAGTSYGQEEDEEYVPRKEFEEVVEELEEELEAVRAEAEAARPGTTSFLLTGYGFAGFTDVEDEDSTFSAGFSPIFLWKVGDRLLFEGELEVELEDGDTHVSLEYGDISLIVNDYVTVVAGKFLSPSNYFQEHLHPAWINKLPDRPLPFGSNKILPDSQLGAQLRGAIPVGAGLSTVNYAVYIANGPALETNRDNAGMLDFKNFEDINNNKAVGVRVGFLPIPALEIGYAFEFSEVNANGTEPEEVDALLHSVDVNAFWDSESIEGSIDLKAQWVWSDVDDVTFDPDGTLGFGPLTFTNERNGGYVQLAYRPSRISNNILKNVEVVGRYDALNLPSGAPIGFDEDRLTVGLDYWFTPGIVFKAAYQFADRDDPEGEGKDEDALMLQLAVGF